jgi:hypothetical protein
MITFMSLSLDTFTRCRSNFDVRQIKKSQKRPGTHETLFIYDSLRERPTVR